MHPPIATWNRARGVWETLTESLLCEHSVPFSQTWPTSGMTRGGSAYPLPWSELLTSVGESSSLLPTPTTEDHTVDAPGRTGGPSLSTSFVLKLPTPRAQNGTDRNSRLYMRPDGSPQNLENALARLTGDGTPPPSPDGPVFWDVPLPFPLLTGD